MSDFTIKLLNLIREGKTANEIAQELNISNKLLYTRIVNLKNKGFLFDRKYYYDGNIVYVPKMDLLNNNDISLITKSSDKELTLVVISDLHIGNDYQRIDLLKSVYDYCAKEGINIIINAGDLVDGTLGTTKKLYPNPIEQIDYAMQIYPFDKNILNFTLLGNHDFSVLKETGQNLALLIQNYRHDIIPIGYGKGQISIKNDKIIVSHPIDEITFDAKLDNKTLLLKGHSHKFKFHFDCNHTIVKVPSLSDLSLGADNQIPTLLKININFNNSGLIEKGVINQLLIADKVYTLNELDFFFYHNITEEKNIKLEEEQTNITKEQTTPNQLKLIKKEERLSQIERFNKRYGL